MPTGSAQGTTPTAEWELALLFRAFRVCVASLARVCAGRGLDTIWRTLFQPSSSQVDAYWVGARHDPYATRQLNEVGRRRPSGLSNGITNGNTHQTLYREITVDNAMHTIAENAARLLLNEYRTAHPQWTDEKTPIDDLVQWVGLAIETFHPDDYEQGVHGFVDPDEDENLIWLRRDLQEAFRRFTLAHELGHAILHCHGGDRLATLAQQYPTAINLSQSYQEIADLPEPSRSDPCADDDIQEDMTSILDEEQFQEALGIGQSYDPRSQRELAANIFAAELLLPRERVLACYTAEQIDPHTLPSRFGVSQAALLNRLAGMLKPAPPAPAPPPAQGKPTAKKRYDEFQQAAIEAPTPALIVAGPGSGKTSTLIGRIEYLIRTLLQYPPTDRGNEENLTPISTSPDVNNPNKTMPNMSNGFARGIAPQNILALTFSRKAAQEMEERLGLVLGDTNGYKLPKVSTFHAFCADILRQHATLVGLRADFALIDEAEGYFLLRQQANALQLRHYQNLPFPTQAFPDMLKAISRAKDELVTPERYAQLAQQMQEHATSDEEREQAEKALEIAHVYQLYEEGLARRGDSDFGGLLMLTLRLFTEHPALLAEIQRKYQHILVDEFQDVNRASGVLLRELAGPERHAWVVGDSNQAIYRFRGASPANISQFEHDFPGAVVLPLSRNYRSRPDLVTLAESFRCQHLEVGQEPGKNQPARLTSDTVDVTLATASNESCEIAGILQDLRRKLAAGYRYNDVVVLCRTRSQVQKFTRALANAQLPVIERSGMLEQGHIKDVLSMLLLLTDATGKGLLRAALQPDHPLSQRDIETVLLAARNPKTTPRQLLLDAEVPLGMSEEGRRSFLRIAQIVRTLANFATQAQNFNIWTLLAQYLFLESSRLRNELAQMQGQQPSPLLADFDRLLQLARHYDQQQAQRAMHISGDNVEKTQLEQIEGFLEYLSLLVLLRQDGSNRQSNSEDDGESSNILRVMTVHASKGLEFPVVYMPELVQQRFPLSNRGSSLVYPQDMLPVGSEGKAAHEGGESCLFYVGVTRARDHLVLSYSERYGKRSYKRSSYLDTLEASLNAERINRLTWDEKSASSLAGMRTEEPVTPLSQPGEDFIDAMRPPTISAAAIEGYLRCPRQYAYSNIYHFSDEPDGYRLFWQTTQKMIEEIHVHFQGSERNEQPAKQAPSSEELQERYTQYWQELGGHEEPFAAMYERHGQEIVEALRRQLALQEEETWDLRKSFTVGIAGKTVHVTIDRVEDSQQEQAPTRFVRTRIKGKRQKEKPEADMRELFYTLAYRQQYPGQPVELHSHNMSTGETVPLKVSPKKEQSLYESAQQAVEGLERNEYPARPAQPFRCPQCPFFFICPS
jgi:superfamily I DNA/RNA helicase/Zn-dependent peptidase ImmA (M78 family)/CRISPR/Cas system-associated exonuclease Cas4 (RecB family)